MSNPHDIVFETLPAHAERLRQTSISRLIADDRQRPQAYALRVGPLYASFARQHYDRPALDALFAIAEAVDLASAVRRLFDGHLVNATEGRAALHTALRSDLSDVVHVRDASMQARAARMQMATMVDALITSGVTDVVSVGIGGSDLGPRLVADALSDGARNTCAWAGRRGSGDARCFIDAVTDGEITDRLGHESALRRRRFAQVGSRTALPPDLHIVYTDPHTKGRRP